MLVRILVQKEVIKPASPKKTDTGKEIPGEFWPEGYQFWCLDASNPPEHRMEETFYYKLKPEEKDIYWGKAVDKVMTVSVRKIIHNEDGTRATLLGSIVPDTTRGAGTGSVPSTKV
jgi:hypothetical protein